MNRFTLRVVLAASMLLAVRCVWAEILPIHDMEAAGAATVTASPWDIGSKDALFDGNWTNIYRSAAVNPALITVQFTTAQEVAAARGSFSNTQYYAWQLDAADTVADLDAQTGTFVHIFGPVQVPGDATTQWEEWNQSPVTRRVFRFTVERLTGDDYVHIRELELQTWEPETLIAVAGDDVRINIITIDPEDIEIPTGQSQAFTAEASLCYGPERYDVTAIANWTTDDTQIASAVAGGLVTALNPGQTTLRASLGVVSGSTPVAVRLVRPADVDVGFIHRTPEYNRFMVSFSGDQHIDPSYLNEQKWPAPGEEVTYTAHIFNRGDMPVADVAYRWYFDDALVGAGTIPSIAAQGEATAAYTAPWPADTVQTVDVPPGAQVLDPPQLERAVGDHRIRIEVDPDNAIAESCEINNTVEDYINALTFWLFMDETTYHLFTQHLSFCESYSPEDWGRGQLMGFERRLRVSGVPQRLRLDMLAIYPDGGLNSGGTHEPVGSETRQADGRWGFQIGEWPESKIAQYAKIVENPLCHEWGHQIGLIDIYQYDIATSNCLIERSGIVVAGTGWMPTVSPWNVWYGNLHVQHASGTAWVDSSERCLMADTSKRFLSPGSAAGMTRNYGLRRGFFGDYLGAIPQGAIKLHVTAFGGTPIANCGIRVFQRDASTGTVPNVAKFTGTTDAAGEWTFPQETTAEWGGISVSNPWAWEQSGIAYACPNAGGGNVPLIVELSFGTHTVEYHFVEVDEVNVAFGQGALGDYTIELMTYASRAGNTLPVISFNGASDDVYLNEGDLCTAQISATDANGDPVTLSATPLYNSTFNPDTGRFTFQPDSLQTNVAESYTESMYVVFKASDGRFVSTRTMRFHVSDVADFAYLNEAAAPGDLNGNGTIEPDDLWIFENCLTGPQRAVLNGCTAADLDGDGDVDLADAALLTQLQGA